MSSPVASTIRSGTSRVYVPKSKIVEVEMSTEDAATLIMPADVVQPGSTR
ncbi:hypothetical protein [Bradyrhizobium cosmicum]|nr:hypothetical protein [Bradyrhizobium cosmicum]